MRLVAAVLALGTCTGCPVCFDECLHICTPHTNAELARDGADAGCDFVSISNTNLTNLDALAGAPAVHSLIVQGDNPRLRDVRGVATSTPSCNSTRTARCQT